MNTILGYFTLVNITIFGIVAGISVQETEGFKNMLKAYYIG